MIFQKGCIMFFIPSVHDVQITRTRSGFIYQTFCSIIYPSMYIQPTFLFSFYLPLRMCGCFSDVPLNGSKQQRHGGHAAVWILTETVIVSTGNRNHGTFLHFLCPVLFVLCICCSRCFCMFFCTVLLFAASFLSVSRVILYSCTVMLCFALFLHLYSLFLHGYSLFLL